MPHLWRSWLALLIPLAAVLVWLCAVPSLVRPAGQPLRTCVLRDTPKMQAATVLANLRRFDCALPQPALAPGDYWVASHRIDPAGWPRDGLNLWFDNGWNERIDLVARYADGRTRVHRLDPARAARQMQLGAYILQPLAAGAGAPVRLLWRVRGSSDLRGAIVAPQLVTDAQVARWNVGIASATALFIGMCLALMVHSLALWGALGHRFQLVYCAMVATMALYALVVTGTLVWIWPRLSATDMLRLSYVTVAWTAAGTLAFMRTFFDPRVFDGWLGRAIRVSLWITTLAGPLFVLCSQVDLVASDRLFWAVLAPTPLLLMPVLWRAWRGEPDYALVFAVAWCTPLLIAAVHILENLMIVPHLAWLDNTTLPVMAIETLLSAVAVTQRIRGLTVERDAAIERAVVARKLADTDPLTGLLNRRSFLERAIGAEGEQLLLIADLDHFKAVNETLGHDGGDEVLRIFARTLRAAVPPAALVARIGGEEFAVVAGAGVALDPDQVLARLRVARMPYDLCVTTSLGSCSGPLLTEVDWKRLYRGADQALFEAKAAGRDRARRAELRAA